MNTWVQDSLIPIYITLSYKGSYMGASVPNLLKFPINPESLEIEVPSSSQTVDIEGIGQVSIPQTPQLAKLTIKSFFWTTNPDALELPAKMYVNWLERWQKSKKPATLVVTRLNYFMTVTCENFKHWTNAGEEKDIYFELSLQEYRPYGAKKLNVIKNETFLDKLKKAKGLLDIPVLVELPRPPRLGSGKKSAKNPYTSKLNDTLLGITKKITGLTKDWKMLYDENKKELGDNYSELSSIPVGTKLILPSKWINESDGNIISGD